MTLFNGTKRGSLDGTYTEVSFKILKIARYDLDHILNNNNNNRLPSKISGWLANPGGKRLKPIEEISQEELYACLYVFTHLRGLQEKAIMFVSVARHHSAKHLQKCAQLLRFSQAPR